MALEFSTAGFHLLYGVESTAGTKPTSFTEIENVVSLNEISLEQQVADVTTIDQTVAHQYIEVLPDPGGTYSLTANFTSEFKTAWTAARTAAKTAWASGLSTWFEIKFPADSGYTDSFFFTGMPGQMGAPAVEVGNATQGSVTIAVREIKGYSTASA